MTYETRAPAARNATHVAPSPGVPLQFAVVAAAGLAVLVWLAAHVTDGAGAAVMGAAAAYGVAALVVLRALRAYPHGRLGACNVVTLVRMVLVGVLLAMLLAPGAGAWTVLSVAGVALLLDGIDGWLARRAGLSSEFGARFDMEVDALLALILACHAYAAGAAGLAILALGVPRYAFWAAGAIWPWLNGDLPERFSRKVVCVVQIGVLIAVLVPGLPRAVADAAVLVAAGALLWSFWVDIRWLKGTRP